MIQNPYVEYEIVDPETDQVIGRGMTLKSTVDFLESGGQKVRITAVLTPLDDAPGESGEAVDPVQE